MTHRFDRNGARAWLVRVLFLYLAAAIAGAAVVVLAGPATLGRVLFAGPPLTVLLNGAILLAFAAGLLPVLGWLGRAAREEAAVNRFWSMNFRPTAEGRPAPRGLDRLDLSRLGRTAMRERVEMLTEVAATRAAVEPGALAEALADQEEPRVAVARYAAGTLVLLGLLGTFVGLLVTIGGVTQVLEGLTVSPDDDLEAFLIQLKAGLREPLGGMALAFSTSLIGLVGSLFVGAGALSLSAAQASWMGKLEQVSALHLAAALPAGLPAAAVAGVAPAVAGDGRHLEGAARALRDGQAASAEHLARLEAASTRVAGSLEDFRDRVAGLASQYERLEAVLARLADAQDRGREAVNDLGVKLAELAGGLAAVRSDVRDGREEVAARVRAAGEGLREATAGGLAELGTAVAAVRDQRVGEAVERLASLLQDDVAARREEARRLLAAIDGLRARSGPAAGPTPSAGLPVRRAGLSAGDADGGSP